MAPLPVPTSSTTSGGASAARGAELRRPRTQAWARSTSSSVSGRGMSARGSAVKARP